MSGLARAYLKVVVAWIWSPTDENLLYFCLGTTSLLVPETFKLKSFATLLPATYNNGCVVKYYHFQWPGLRGLHYFLSARFG